MFGNIKSKSQRVSAVIVAAGNSTRMGTGKSKQLIEIEGKPVIAHTLSAFENSSCISEVIVVTKEEHILAISDIAKEFSLSKVTKIISGGETRAESVKNGIEQASFEYVAIHDGARPCITPEDIKKVVERAFETGAAAPGHPVTDTLKVVDNNRFIKSTVDRSSLWHIQTPQVFERSILLNAYKTCDYKNATDDCILAESTGVKVAMVEGSKNNIKVTVEQDIPIAAAILKENLK